MSASTTTETRTTPSQNRNRRGNRARGRGSHRNGPDSTRAARRSGDKPTLTPDEPAPHPTSNEASKTPTVTANGTTNDEDTTAAVCWICAEPVKYYSLSACNHRTCHVCGLRLRALYKKLECTFCKASLSLRVFCPFLACVDAQSASASVAGQEPQSTVIFTTSPDTDFASYTPHAIPYKDAKLAIFFETQDMMEETLILLRFNCPDAECDYIASGWGDLKLHTRAVHGKVLCDLCIRSKKVFAHEHALYPPNVLPLHLPSIPLRLNKPPLKEPIEGGVHPLCEFCRECFFSEDELFVHMRERHEECFICKRNEIRDQYFQNWESLELHFSQAHFACTNAVCQAQKFVVFSSELDLKAHQVEVHGADMSSKDKKDARRVLAEFEFDDTGGSSRRGRRDRGDREREREPPPQIVQVQARVAGRRREAFGGHLTEGTTQATQPSVPSGRASPTREDLDPLIAERHASFITRLQHVAPNPSNATAAVKAAMRGYRANESSARDLISTVWNVLDHDLDDTASIINSFVDLLEEEEKKRDLLTAWNGFKIEQRQQFPDLVPTAVGSGYAGITSGRVLNAKHATASRSSQQSSRQLWDRVAQAASASSSTSRNVPGASAPPSTSSSAAHVVRFPPLAGPSSTPAFRQPQRHTPWASASSAAGSGSSITPTPPAVTPSPSAISPRKKGKGPVKQTQPPALSVAAFPELPTVQPKAKPVVSLRRILGDAGPATSVWRASGNGNIGGGGGGVGASAAGEVGGQAQMQTQTVAQEQGQWEMTGGKGKKGKGKQKQTLFTFGSFPT
ncbi:hypothetical protein HD554DRAFT_2165703 [Boletus coccyginus]|nr:hypothetical protein HD554DRAFT_2165703 [Boletus coccyginus]